MQAVFMVMCHKLMCLFLQLWHMEVLMSNIWMALDVMAKKYPQRIALQAGTSTLTYYDLREKVRLTAGNMRDLGLSSESFVALLFQNTPSCVMGFLALAMLHVRVVLLSSETILEDVHGIMEEAGASALLGCQPTLERFCEVPFLHPTNLLDIDHLLALRPATLVDGEDISVPGDQAFVYYYTSGSTGYPKAVMHSQQNLISSGEIYQLTYRITVQDTLLVAVPLSHSFGLVAGLVTSLLAGARLLLIERFLPAQVMDILEHECVSFLVGTPLVYDLLTRYNLQRRYKLPALRVSLSSGSPLPLAVAERFTRRFEQPIYEVYGSTETGVIAAQWPIETTWPVHSVGRALTGTRIRLVDDAGNDVPQGAVGQLIVQTPGMFLGYFNDSQENITTFLNGWYHTGDLTWQNSHGDLFLVGRAPISIDIDERKINPLEIEAVLLSHPQVHEVLVYAEEGLCAALVVEGEVSVENLRAFCHQRLALFQIPDNIILVPELPRGELGKLRRAASGIRSS